MSTSMGKLQSLFPTAQDSSKHITSVCRRRPLSCQVVEGTRATANFRELSRCADGGDCLRILPFADRDHQVQLGVVGKIIDIRLAIRSVMVQCLEHLLIQSDDHDVWPNVEFIATSDRVRLVWYPEAAVHICNSDTLHIGRTAGHTVLRELQKDLVEATGIIIMGSSRQTRKTGPLIGAGSESAELAAGRRRPVEHGCIL